MSPTILVVAKAPVPGLAKTRVAVTVGDDLAADLAAAALLDTLEVVGSVGWPVVVAMTGDLSVAARSAEIRTALGPFAIIPQRGAALAQRLVAAHLDADGGLGVVQIGMDTPQVAAIDIIAAGEALGGHDAVVGPAGDGGWWLLAVRSPIHAKALAGVPMSTTDTCRDTVHALVGAGATVRLLRPLDDIDTWDDARAVAIDHPHLRASAVVAEAR